MIAAIQACPGSGMTLRPPPAPKGAARAVAAPASSSLGVCNLKGPNLDLNDKLVKRGLLVSWYGRRGTVQRVRTGRCLISFVVFDRRFDVTRYVEKMWLSCRSVQVVEA